MKNKYRDFMSQIPIPPDVYQKTGDMLKNGLPNSRKINPYRHWFQLGAVAAIIALIAIVALPRLPGGGFDVIATDLSAGHVEQVQLADGVLNFDEIREPGLSLGIVDPMRQNLNQQQLQDKIGHPFKLIWWPDDMSLVAQEAIEYLGTVPHELFAKASYEGEGGQVHLLLATRLMFLPTGFSVEWNSRMIDTPLWVGYFQQEERYACVWQVGKYYYAIDSYGISQEDFIHTVYLFLESVQP